MKFDTPFVYALKNPSGAITFMVSMRKWNKGKGYGLIEREH